MTNQPIENKVRWGTKTFYSFDDIDFEDIMQILDDWQAGRANSGDVNGFAELIDMIWGAEGLPELPADDPRSILVVIIILFDGMFGEILLKEDIPVFKDVLNVGRLSPEVAFKKLDDYLMSLDQDARYKMVKKRLGRGLGWPD